ncbi:MAG: hypothetical protein M1816_006930 [Peltula sp. TS41687]|nr:MAG: hypothetical protein M1816_006930 [Peltula sp. TS41687]
MVGHRRKDIVTTRRRVEDEGEEEVGSEIGPLEDDSLSEGTALSDLDDEDADADGSDISEQDGPEPKTSSNKDVTGNGHAGAMNGAMKRQPTETMTEKDRVATIARADTEAMMNGLKKPEVSNEADEIDFDDLKENGAEVRKTTPANGQMEARSSTQKPELPHERRRREQEEYRRKRDADPTFVPNRGGFFMHDHRHPGPAANGFRPFGRGRGKGTISAPFLQTNQTSRTSEAMSGPWSHDLHEVVAQDEPPRLQRGASADGRRSSNGQRPQHLPPKPSPLNRSFSKTTHVSNVQIRVLLPSMKDPIIFTGVPVKQHTRLPQHRPPLRRDKPVRVSLPSTPPRYIFPSVERSFIFIPRALRPNQQGRTAGRGGLGSFRGFSSRRTSAYGGSLYSPSVALSRRSSLAQEITRDNITPQSATTGSRPQAAFTEPNKPIVRLPPTARPVQGSQQIGVSRENTNTGSVVSGNDFSGQALQYPAYRENRSIVLPMHQPRPQKAVSMAGIESPERMSFPPPPQQQQQPFHQQILPEMNGAIVPFDPSQHPHFRQLSHLGQPLTGTPLPQIPERAIHAQPFQPHYISAQPLPPPPFYPQPFTAATAASGTIVYPTSDGRAPGPYSPAVAASTVSAPVFVPGQPQGTTYMMAIPPPTAAPPPPPLPPQQQQQPTGQSGTTFAQESNGMVYYYDASQVYSAGGFAPASYGLTPTAGTMSVAGVIAPGNPEGYFYPHPGAQGTVYYGQ